MELADPTETCNDLEVDVLIGSDTYWSLVTGKVTRSEFGPIAIHSKVGWILSGPVDQHEVSMNLCTSSIHNLKIDTYQAETSLDRQLSRFWDLDSLGIDKDEPPVYNKFVQQIKFDGRRYEVRLPWKENHASLPDNRQLCQARLTSLIKR